MIDKISKIPVKDKLFSSLSISIFVHLMALAILFSGNLFSDKVISIEGDNSLKAVMIDLTVMAAPKQSLVEDSLERQKIEEKSIEEEKKIEKAPEKKAKYPLLETKKEEAKRKEKHKNKQLPQKSSHRQIRQEVKADNIATSAVAPKLSSNAQFSETPTLISRNHPTYPLRALDLGIEGHVIVLYDINEQGRVENIRIIEAKPNNIFNRAVIQAMEQWQYQATKAKDLTIRVSFNRNKSVDFDRE